MGQGICPMAPLSYDEESLINLTVLVEEEQDITIFPCTLSYMTGPESLLGVVVHDIAICLAGVVYIQMLKPGTGVGFSKFFHHDGHAVLTTGLWQPGISICSNYVLRSLPVL